jgi:DNA-binding Lrp family transcriptional regulator
MSPETAGKIARYARQLLANKVLTPHDFSVLNVLLWVCRRHGRRDLTVSYRDMARLANVSRDSAINSVRKLTDLGVLERVKRRIRVFWSHNRSQVASRQTANAYVFLPQNTGSRTSATDRESRLLRGNLERQIVDKSRRERKSDLERALASLAGAAGLSLSG